MFMLPKETMLVKNRRIIDELMTSKTRQGHATFLRSTNVLITRIYAVQVGESTKE